ncbi:multifunctional oxoglutarate decarboxylase/oxoglutarate dehydrogenase thiamine pyrophosphate-binding subunit/dihydrolipoyllysine-residue succinyltransferase subunit [Glycomyces buryatensis]|uniref:Multifunctional oxoglutarate decarboxylase/oxoglutarate dehydrogenase thiamine pyrophosphate-binding subunit/dihydrolipoyllysine-residue succinyltransferase subunit n=1 Tax=Glycomyces buryatensis TaxID=2570927 RepID=A0A4V4HQZ6_9ACTN|nr:multifunctional oxoglutarate decarboxylase/oxoglutarate dehydrogenase thiamine pyrophosphate-binding subunit/dihydrolipoyllysine-residue succinyltransferase subunit [Glycomyces buryatensis]THV35776.1 multifunctional oxoglutarate decarboxylase/oxoglutarate dehydrogenase thiamine pyrophosphate-binding subunit/dihydrolipoyllysine-residue succinyltransferase subunit [Glycomyces buryatensis]
MSSATPRNPLTDFGANEWLVNEMYERYRENPDSVSAGWREFFGGDPTPAAKAADSVTAAVADASRKPEAEITAKVEKPQAAPAPVVPAAPTPAPQTASTEKKAAPIVNEPEPTAPASGSAAIKPLKGVAAKVAQNMDASLEIPTATSVRAVPAKLLFDNRIVINNHLKRGQGGKVSFTHLIGYALVQAVKAHPGMNAAYKVVDGKPQQVTPASINLGLAIDLAKPDGSRTLVVPSIKHCESMDFREFWQAYEDLVRKARTGKLTMEDHAGATLTLTNPGGIGTVHSVPRLMKGQGLIVGVGAMEVPAEFAGASDETLADLGVSKIMTVTSTYDHRIIQGAESGQFLATLHRLLLGDDFFDQIFKSLYIPYEPVRWVRDVSKTHEGQIDKNARIIELIHAYRVRGHLMADTNPLHYEIRRHPDLDILSHGLTLWDLDRTFPVGGFAGQQRMSLREILGVLRDSYCRRIGVEYMHIQDPEERQWLQRRIEVPFEKPKVEEQKHILGRLNAAEAFETFLQTKFVGQKRFSLEGGESLIPLLDQILNEAANEELDEVVIGMPHRGRLNVLANIVGKKLSKIFTEFEGHIDPKSIGGSGDVKYHLGLTGKFTSPDGRNETVVSVAANPSHLEAVNPVLEGIVRAKQDKINLGEEGFTVLPLAIHGDAAFAGQGVVAETLNLSQLRGYRTGGTVHAVVNNQVGFTTAPLHSRSSLYCTDVARMIQAPIFHVNGDDPEAVCEVAKLAFAYRQQFRKDVVIDMVCYRRRGHNEGDDPKMTNPEMYQVIDSKQSVRKLYTRALIGRGDITMDDAEEALADYQAQLERVFRETKEALSGQTGPMPWRHQPEPVADIDTSVDAETVAMIGKAHTTLPEGFEPHKAVRKVLEKRSEMSTSGNVDWAFAETLAFGSLLMQGKAIRLAGQDSRRGTFVQRHSVAIDQATGAEYTPLNHLGEQSSKFFVYDSLLSEYAAMGFEYGYSVENPEMLVAWEAQFGDFVDGAQTITDEFISSGEAKWGQHSGLTLLLPHGHEGAGPDHTSGRIERFLQLCADENMRVVNSTSPANYFHLLRRQALDPVKKPLIVFTPKSLLRHKAAVSQLDEFTSGRFQPVMPDPALAAGEVQAGSVKKILLCSGKIYYDLANARRQRGITDTAIVRVEQLYPLPAEELQGALGAFPNADDIAWVQEEPANQGAWSHIALNLLEQLGGVHLRRISRPAAAAPSTGSPKVHEVEQRALVDVALPQPS